MASQKRFHFRRWVPKWLQLVTALVILIPTMLVNGAYTGSSVDISSYLGVLTEDINMAFFASSAGMAVAYPLIVKIRPIITTKTLLICNLILQVLFSFLCASTGYTELIALCSFMIGFFKGFTLLEIMTILMPIFSPDNKRSQFYAFFYPISLGLGQISLALTSRLAYLYQWQFMYYFMVILLLIAIILILVCLRYGRRPIRIPFRDIDWISVMQITTFFMSTIYIFTYGKVNDWFASPKIIWGSILSFFSLLLFVRRQLTLPEPYVDLRILQNRNSLIGYLFMFIMSFFTASGSLILVYENSVLRLDSIRANQLYLWMIPGFLFGAVVSWYWFERQLRMRYIVSLGLFFFLLSLIFLYFQVHPYGLYENLYLPMALRGVGMMILFISFGVYVIRGLPPTKLIFNAFFLIGTRAVLAPVLCASLFTNWLYYLQQKNLIILSETLNMDNPIVASRYGAALKSSISQGVSIGDASQVATNSLYNAVQLQSTTLSVKTIFGYCLILCLILTIAAAIFPFYRVGGIKETQTGADMV